MYDAIFLTAGVVTGSIVFWKNPVLPENGNSNSGPKKISVIIPARNEEKNLRYILGDLERQRDKIHEIICVDDQSEDGTQEVAEAFGAKLISVDEKPEGWTGKSWACHLGAQNASGELLLFLDADVRLHRDAVLRISGAYEKMGCAISVQPYHLVEKPYEQMSLFFNIVGSGANGICMPFRVNSVGLFGPLILLERDDYWKIGGHRSVRESVTDDLELGEMLTKSKVEYRLFLGGKYIGLRMYGEGIGQLVEGWSKNYATGAIKTSPAMLALLTVWIGAYISAAFNLLISVTEFDIGKIVLYLSFYTVLAIQLMKVAGRIGNFKKITSMLYPVPLLAFILIFAVSVFKKLFLGKTEWKGRKINLRR